ncbi:hypothetical protein BV25DRAFT_228345 [Artomyces pyxidatus]|uniref:Uncharacterized protein n=1 Tax=Artomyces pyxidatus TaxID=48021 RepID=A0ACB8SHX3_9AGAM|nr:hypothetical protein BV25DRAFT_228345 [Artomyces pyxidatus]
MMTIVMCLDAGEKPQGWCGLASLRCAESLKVTADAERSRALCRALTRLHCPLESHQLIRLLLSCFSALPASRAMADANGRVCYRTWHHRCHVPPVEDERLVGMLRNNDLNSWACKKCLKALGMLPVRVSDKAYCCDEASAYPSHPREVAATPET